MNLNDLLVEYEQVATECRELLETEIDLFQKGKGGSDPAVLDRKQELISRLDALLKQLKGIREASGESPAMDRSRVNFLQQKFMQILRLDRDLEKLLLKERSQPADPLRGQATNNPRKAAERYKQSESSI